ncbi:hypothetical protein PTSG_12742 [Salpingoeca rosetta]|uniref:Uncharacterized protein n=1 Tax=Salpingoeca rosetta (strain ATCC 50818 / BSB-021) TaxID=946362 RepID=F2UJW2_SALR5|nr:uncharacterized protein PTSG_12742 [Salpingoeca rosetta]EGD77411.1 hypothetical protein PTSG_12742 [Salpingoeca rosetta]|eukprot:XP_004990755.1 hypothetical protein PTSG_12742 [Salpingoeca rosetta]
MTHQRAQHQKTTTVMSGGRKNPFALDDSGDESEEDEEEEEDEDGVEGRAVGQQQQRQQQQQHSGRPGNPFVVASSSSSASASSSSRRKNPFASESGDEDDEDAGKPGAALRRGGGRLDTQQEEPEQEKANAGVSEAKEEEELQFVAATSKPQARDTQGDMARHDAGGGRSALHTEDREGDMAGMDLGVLMHSSEGDQRDILSDSDQQQEQQEQQEQRRRHGFFDMESSSQLSSPAPAAPDEEDLPTTTAVKAQPLAAARAPALSPAQVRHGTTAQAFQDVTNVSQLRGMLEAVTQENAELKRLLRERDAEARVRRQPRVSARDAFLMLARGQDCSLEAFRPIEEKIRLADMAERMGGGVATTRVAKFLAATLKRTVLVQVLTLRPRLCTHYINHLRVRGDWYTAHEIARACNHHNKTADEVLLRHVYGTADPTTAMERMAAALRELHRHDRSETASLLKQDKHLLAMQVVTLANVHTDTSTEPVVSSTPLRVPIIATSQIAIEPS